MSFSHPDFARFVAEHFEPTWESVRDVPQVTIDFGGGNVVRRTLHGNIATYICLADGTVVDVIAGVYDRRAYRGRLQVAAGFATEIAALPRGYRVAEIRRYHASQLARLENSRGAGRVDARKRVLEVPLEELMAKRPALATGVTKLRIEDSVETLVTRGHVNALPVIPGVQVLDDRPLRSFDLSLDTANNERERRPRVHRLLAAEVRPTVSGLTKRIYRDVLGTDLDDPLLGLGQTLFENYPFGR